MAASTPELPPAVVAWALDQGLGRPVQVQTLAGGCINQVRRIRFEHGQSRVLKTPGGNPAAGDPGYAREAAGLRLLVTVGGPLLPRVELLADGVLLLSDLGGASPRPGYWRELGSGLARIHARSAAGFGLPEAAGAESARQARHWLDGLSADGREFFRDRQLLPLARSALAREPALLAAAERLAARVLDLVPRQVPALVHGDLWHGNAAVGPQGEPALLDPAAHFGSAEMELAMTLLFGGFPPEFYAAYAEQRPPLPGFAERVALYQLPPLLHHVQLFGAAYLPQVAAHLGRYDSR